LEFDILHLNFQPGNILILRPIFPWGLKRKTKRPIQSSGLWVFMPAWQLATMRTYHLWKVESVLSVYAEKEDYIRQEHGYLIYISPLWGFYPPVGRYPGLTARVTNISLLWSYRMVIHKLHRSARFVAPAKICTH